MSEEQYEAKKKQVEEKAAPLFSGLYGEGGAGATGAGTGMGAMGGMGAGGMGGAWDGGWVAVLAGRRCCAGAARTGWARLGLRSARRWSAL